MNRRIGSMAAVAGVLMVAVMGVGMGSTEPKASQALETAGAVLGKALDAARAEPARAGEHLRAAAVSAAETLGDSWQATGRLQAAAAMADVEAMRAEVARVHADLTFRPRIEAPVPPGWPAFTPVGEIEVKTYPTYRAAFTTKKPIFFRESRNFWTLFQHISSRNIPMTAPVEMPMEKSGSGLREVGMAFLYPDTSTGELGETDNGAVQVIDVPPVTVVNIGIRGKSTEARVASAYERLEAWLAANSDRWERAGNPRVLGWNSPSMPDRMSYTEVQIPVRPVASGGGQ